MVREYMREQMTPDLEARFGERIDKAVWKVSGLLPVEWSVDLANQMRALVAEAAGAPESEASNGAGGEAASG